MRVSLGVESAGLEEASGDALVDAPRCFDLDVSLAVDLGVEQVGQPLVLEVGEQVSAGVQGSTGTVEGAVLASMPLGALAAAGQRVTGEADDVEGLQHRRRSREVLGGGGLADTPGPPGRIRGVVR